MKEYKLTCTASQELKAVLILFVDAQPQLSDAEYVAGLREHLTTETLLNPEILIGPSTLYRILRDYLLRKGFGYVSHPSSSRIYKGLANCFLEDEDGKTYAFSIVDNLRNDTPTPSGQTCVITQMTDTSRNDNDSERKLAHSLSQRFKKEERFTGKLGENIEEYFDNYKTASEDYALTEQQKFRYLHNLFDEDAKRFYRTNVQYISLSYNEARTKMENEYNIITRQSRVKQYLQSLHLNKIIEKESCDVG